MNIEDPDSFSTRPSYRRIGIYLPALVLAGLSLLILVYFLAMQTLGWTIPSLSSDSSPSSGKSNTTVALYASPTTRDYFTSVGGNYDLLLDAWRKYLATSQLKHQELSDPKQLSTLGKSILVLPSAVALTADERLAVEDFKRQGGSILLTWASGTRIGNSDWSGWEWLESLSGARHANEVAAGDNSAGFLITNGESPLGNSLPAGQRIWLGNNREALLNFEPLADARRAAQFMNWERAPASSHNTAGAIIYNEHANHARTAVFGFAESTWEYQPHLIYPLINDTLIWLGNQASVVKGAWPHGKRSAQIVEMDTEQGFANALRMASMMQHINYYGTFYVLTSTAVQFPEVLRTLARDFEIAYHGDVHTSFKDLPREVQQQRIDAMQSQMRSILPEPFPITGFRAPTEGYDQITESLLVEAGIRHHLADPHGTESRLPFFASIEGADSDALVVLPRTQRDDINFLKEPIDADHLTKALIADFDLSREQGALGILSVHTQNFENDAPLTSAMPNYLAHLNTHRDETWLAPAAEVAQWWRDRERISIRSRNLGHRLELDLSVKGSEPVSGATMIVMLPRKSVLPEVQGGKPGMPKAKAKLLDPYRAAIVFDSLEPADYLYQITF